MIGIRREKERSFMSLETGLHNESLVSLVLLNILLTKSLISLMSMNVAFPFPLILYPADVMLVSHETGKIFYSENDLFKFPYAFVHNVTIPLSLSLSLSLSVRYFIHFHDFY
jgi:hypothetical protein